MTVDMNLGSTPLVAQLLGGSTLHVRELIAGLVVYVKLPPVLVDKLPGAKPWLEVDIAKAAAAAGVPGVSSLGENPAASDPSQMLQYLRGASGHLTNLGSASVDGFQTTHYRAVVDLDRVPNLVPAASRNAARQSISALESLTHLHQIPIDVWVDGQHLVRKEQLSYSVSADGQSLRMQTTVNVPDYGPQPAPALPASSQVTNLSASGSTA
jgi:hypothetical protein